MIDVVINSLGTADRILILRDRSVIFDGTRMTADDLVNVLDQLTTERVTLFRLSNEGLENYLENL